MLVAQSPTPIVTSNRTPSDRVYPLAVYSPARSLRAASGPIETGQRSQIVKSPGPLHHTDIPLASQPSTTRNGHKRPRLNEPGTDGETLMLTSTGSAGRARLSGDAEDGRLKEDEGSLPVSNEVREGGEIGEAAHGDTSIRVDESATQRIPTEAGQAGRAEEVARDVSKSSEMDGGESAGGSLSKGESETKLNSGNSTAEPGRSISGPPSVSGADAAKVLTADQQPSSTEASGSSPNKPVAPHMDLGTYPTPELLKILASLLQQIAVANDALRPPPSPGAEDAEGAAGVAGMTGGDISRGSESRSPAVGQVAFANGGRREEPQATLSASPTQQAVQPVRKSSRGSMVDSMVIPPFRPKHGSAAGSASSVSSKAPDPGQPTRSASTSSPSSSKTASVKAPNVPPPASASTSSASPATSSSSRLNQNPSAPIPPIPRHSGSSSSSSTPGGTQFTTTAARKSIMHPSAILCFHARNVPSISIEAYLQRILKYCPITNEVFLSLLIYFDRMSRTHYGDLAMGGDGTGSSKRLGGSASSQTLRGFAIDSFNVHRLVIAGITVASKFFSDIFYTNSRYAKVGGLPQTELNQLELQFLLLNDFNLQIPLEEMQRYADQLLVYWSNKGKEGSASAPVPPGSTSSPESVVRSESGRGDKRKRQESTVMTNNAGEAGRENGTSALSSDAEGGSEGRDETKAVGGQADSGMGSPMAVDVEDGGAQDVVVE